jgi:hypothetical protein
MPLEPNEIIIAGTGTLYSAPEGTPLPAHLNSSLDAAFLDVGYITEDGAKFTDEKSVDHVRPWQSFYPVRTHITERSGMLEVGLLQWNEGNMILAYGGGGMTQPSPGVYRYHPPAPEELDVVALVLDMVDGTRNFRFTIGRAFVTSSVESTFAKTGAALLPVTFEVLANGDLDPWTADSDDPAWAPVAS